LVAARGDAGGESDDDEKDFMPPSVSVSELLDSESTSNVFRAAERDLRNSEERGRKQPAGEEMVSA
jgi:hypothetical protein